MNFIGGGGGGLAAAAAATATAAATAAKDNVHLGQPHKSQPKTNIALQHADKYILYAYAYNNNV